jgi:hypothetical protein
MALIKWSSTDQVGIVLSDNNYTGTGAIAWGVGTRATAGKSSGKWYWEYTLKIKTNINGFMGYSSASYPLSQNYIGTTPYSFGYQIYGAIYYNSTTPFGSGAGSVTAIQQGDVVGFALDIDLNTLSVYVNGVLSKTCSAYLTGMGSPIFPTISPYGSKITVNFGSTPFSYPIPNGYSAYDSDNLYAGVKRTSLNSLNVGDYIECEYTATSGTAGTFTNLGSTSKSEIPIYGTNSPDGKFKFICVERKAGKGGLCIADRNIQTGISWDSLNAGNLIEGKPGIFANALIRSLSGGCAYRKPTYMKDLMVMMPLSDDTNITKDLSPHAFPISKGTTVMSATQKKFGTKSLYFNNVDTDKITIVDGGDLNFGALPFQIEMWIYPINTGAYQFFYDKRVTNGTAEGLVFITDGTSIIAYAQTSSGWDLMAGTNFGTMNINQWNHLVLLRDSRGFGSYINGTYRLAYGNATNKISKSSADLFIGYEAYGGTQGFKGYMQDIRIIKGMCMYSGDSITVPTAPLNDSVSLITGNNLSTVDYEIGNFPDNEWDTFIVNSNLKGKIVAGDNSIWHWDSINNTFVSETIISTMGVSTARVVRPFNSISGLTYSTTATENAFRPVLEFHEDGTVFY